MRILDLCTGQDAMYTFVRPLTLTDCNVCCYPTNKSWSQTDTFKLDHIVSTCNNPISDLNPSLPPLTVRTAVLDVVTDGWEEAWKIEGCCPARARRASARSRSGPGPPPSTDPRCRSTSAPGAIAPTPSRVSRASVPANARVDVSIIEGQHPAPSYSSYFSSISVY